MNDKLEKVRIACFFLRLLNLSGKAIIPPLAHFRKAEAVPGCCNVHLKETKASQPQTYSFKQNITSTIIFDAFLRK